MGSCVSGRLGDRADCTDREGARALPRAHTEAGPEVLAPPAKCSKNEYGDETLAKSLGGDFMVGFAHAAGPVIICRALRRHI